MSVQNLVHSVFLPADITSVNTALDEIKAKMSFLTPLTSDQKSSLFKMGDAYNPFVIKSIAAVTAHPEIMSGTFDKDELIRDFDLMNALKPILQKVALLHQALEDTVSAAGSDALAAALEVYTEVKNHVDSIPGFSDLAADMHQYFPRRRRTPDPDPDPVPTPNSN